MKHFRDTVRANPAGTGEGVNCPIFGGLDSAY
jgi:hypothetical protein